MSLKILTKGMPSSAPFTLYRLTKDHLHHSPFMWIDY
jgi:hypothetical protein